MDLGIAGKTALVTGAGRGIGRATAIELAREGVTLFLVSRTLSYLQDLRREIDHIMTTDSYHYIMSLDMMEDSAPNTLINRVITSMGMPDIVVNNLGGNMTDIDDEYRDPLCSIDMYRKVHRLNFEVAVELNAMIIPSMIEKGWGRIVNVSSLASLENHGTIPYCTSKAALTAYTRSMGRYLAPTGVVMSAIIPGAIESVYWDEVIKTRPEHLDNFLNERQRIGRLGRPEEMAHVIAFLCSMQASFCTGSIVPADGGMGRGYFCQ